MVKKIVILTFLNKLKIVRYLKEDMFGNYI